MTWWCAARDVAWTWTWQAYPGVWLFVLIIAGAYVKGTASLERSQISAQQRRLFFLGLAAVWIAADWPVGALGAGYLLSVHQAQFVLFVMVGPPLMILGTPPAVWRRLMSHAVVATFVGAATRPALLFISFNAIVIATHLPGIVDGLMASQPGSFGLDMAWIAAGFALWWPVISPVPEANGLSYPGRFGYLLASIVLPAAPPLFLIFADYPLYALYELAPPIGGISAASDQLVGGLIMKFGSAVAVLTAATILWFKWHAAEGGDEQTVTYRQELPTPGR